MIACRSGESLSSRRRFREMERIAKAVRRAVFGSKRYESNRRREVAYGRERVKRVESQLLRKSSTGMFFSVYSDRRQSSLCHIVPLQTAHRKRRLTNRFANFESPLSNKSRKTIPSINCPFLPFVEKYRAKSYFLTSATTSQNAYSGEPCCRSIATIFPSPLQ